MKRKLSTLFNRETVVEKLHKQALMFSIVGSICFIIDTSILAILVEVCQLSIIPATILAFVIANIVNYFLSIKFIFINGKFSIHNEVGGFFLISLMGLGFNVLLMHVFVNLFEIWFLWAKFFTALLVMSFNFTTKKWLLFIR